MRIAFVLLGDLSLTSGGFIYDRMLIEGLRARGHELDVVSLPWLPYFAQVAENRMEVAWPRPVAEYDVILQDELAHPSLAVRNWVLRERGIPVVALVHNLTWRQPRVRSRTMKRVIETAYLRAVDGAVCVCEDTRRDVARSLARAASSVVVYAGRDHLSVTMDSERACARAGEGGPLRVAMLCNVVAHKGLHRVLAAMRNAANTELHVIGPLSDTRYMEAQRRFASVHHLTERVHFHGELRGDALWTQLSRAQVLALPSDREAFPLAAIEALALGLPVLATDQGGAGELVRDDVEGRLLPPDDERAWTQTLLTLASDRALLTRMSCAALSRYQAHGTWAQAAEKAEAFLTEISARRTARRLWFRS